jgi:hypothetical protein
VRRGDASGFNAVHGQPLDVFPERLSQRFTLVVVGDASTGAGTHHNVIANLDGLLYGYVPVWARLRLPGVEATKGFEVGWPARTGAAVIR